MRHDLLVEFERHLTRLVVSSLLAAARAVPLRVGERGLGVAPLNGLTPVLDAFCTWPRPGRPGAMGARRGRLPPDRARGNGRQAPARGRPGVAALALDPYSEMPSQM